MTKARAKGLVTALAMATSGAMAIAACSDDPSVQPTANDAGSDAVATSDAPSKSEASADAKVSSDVADAASTPMGTLSATCAATDFCFDVSPVNVGTTPLSGYVAVIWSQLDDDGPDPQPDIAFVAPLKGTETKFGIPMAQLRPPSEANLLCKRDCDDEATCPCTADPKMGIGYVVVMRDTNQNGVLDLSYSSSQSEPIVGVARMVIGYSDKAFMPAPAPYDQLYVNGIEQGTRAYDVIEPDTGFDQLGTTSQTKTWDLKVCDTEDDNVCKLPFPNLT